MIREMTPGYIGIKNSQSASQGFPDGFLTMERESKLTFSSHFLGAFPKLREETITFVAYVCMSVNQSVRMEQLESQ
jgi:hypothetical protein